jgi:hypothetical protein
MRQAVIGQSALKALIKEAHDVEPSLGIRLLTDLKTVFGDADQMATVAILNALYAMPEAPWNDLHGKPINERGLATRLRQYGIKPKVIRVGGTTPRGYSRQDFHDPWLAYLPPLAPGGSATSATTETSEEKPSLFKAKGVADAGEVKRKNPQNICAHCGQPGGLPVAYDGRQAFVHPHCRSAWRAVQDAVLNQRLRLVAGSSV